MHFVLLGAAVLVAYEVLAPPPADVVRVPATAVAAQVRRFTDREGRPPTADERAALVEGWVEDAILHREARALGLDRSDPIVRRRLIQKMRFLHEDLADLEAPPERALEAHLAAHADDYRTPDRFTFRHVFLAADRHDDLDAAVAAAAEALRGGADPAGVGDPFVHGGRFAALDAPRAATLFGGAFVAALREASPGVWAPARSSFGAHLVRVEETIPGAVPPLAAVRSRVLADWREAERARAAKAAMERLRARYEVRVEGGDEAGS